MTDRLWSMFIRQYIRFWLGTIAAAIGIIVAALFILWPMFAGLIFEYSLSEFLFTDQSIPRMWMYVQVGWAGIVVSIGFTLLMIGNE